MLSPSYIILKIKKKHRTNSVDLDVVAHYEPPHQDLHCLQFSSLVVKKLNGGIIINLIQVAKPKFRFGHFQELLDNSTSPFAST